jgi:hypothetical protein
MTLTEGTHVERNFAKLSLKTHDWFHFGKLLCGVPFWEEKEGIAVIAVIADIARHRRHRAG